MKAILFKITTCLLLGSLITLSTFADDLKIGAAAVKVTPPIGTPMAGYYYERGVVKIHDDLYAKALVIEKNGIKIAIVECDFVDISDYIVGKVRKLVEKSTGIDAAHVMIGATHCHTGPVIPSSPSTINIGVDANCLLRVNQDRSITLLKLTTKI